MEEQKRQRTFVKAFNKYIDELTVEEWEEMNNATCDSALRNCDFELADILEEQEKNRNK